jgi:hypothetical protein
VGGRGGGGGRNTGIGRAVPSDVPPGDTRLAQAAINAYWAARATSVQRLGYESEWVRFSNLRAEMSARGLSFAQQDEAIRSIATRRDVRINPVENLKSMTVRDQASRLFIGGQYKDMMIMYRPQS